MLHDACRMAFVIIIWAAAAELFEISFRRRPLSVSRATATATAGAGDRVVTAASGYYLSSFITSGNDGGDNNNRLRAQDTDAAL